MTTAAIHPDPPVLRLPAGLRLGPVRLAVRDLNRSVAWYQRSLGLRIHRQQTHVAALGDGATTAIELTEDVTAAPAGRHAGLYHYALLYPSREELARAVIRLARTGTPIQGASDHGTHEAIYLPDPDGLGIELAADRPRDRWPNPEREPSGPGPQPLDLERLLAAVAPGAASEWAPPGLRVGHLHLHVSSIEHGLAFYRDLIGFELRTLLPTAAFVSAGGYHHHLAFNTWRGQGVPPPTSSTVGLRNWTLELPTEADVALVGARLRAAGAPIGRADRGLITFDPWNICVRIVQAATA